jgi:tetratricopeptide (TPR) repeat protein
MLSGMTEVAPGGRRWTVALFVAAISVAGATLAWRWLRSQVSFVNGLDIPVRVRVDDSELRLASHGRERRDLGRGRHNVSVATDDGRRLDEEVIEIPGGGDSVDYNVLGAAPLSHGAEPTLDVGQKLIVRPRADELQPGGWRLSLGYLLSLGRFDEAARLAEAVARAQPDDESTLEVVAMVILRARGVAGLQAFAEKLAEAQPDAVEAQRLEQSMMLQAGRRAEAVARYRERAAKHPDSPAAAYLAARLDAPAEALPQLERLSAQRPDDARVRRQLAWARLELRQFAASARDFEALSKLPHRVNADEVKGRVLALGGAGDWAQAARVAADRVADRSAGSDGAMLYARAARRAGARAPHPPDHFLDGSNQEARAFYEAELGRPGDFEKLPAVPEPTRSACAILAAARRNGVDALVSLDHAPVEALAALPRPSALVLAAWSQHQGDHARAARILDAMAPPASAAERAALLAATPGEEPPELANADLETRAALELARGWRLGGEPGRALAERARADDLLGGLVTDALSWH